MILNKKDLATVASANILAVILFFLLYNMAPYKPYSNMVYFLVMGIAGLYYAESYSSYSFMTEPKKTVVWSFLGSGLMLFGYGLLRAAYGFVKKYPALSAKIDTGQWSRFVTPWIKINLSVSVAGIILVVLATEFFYRAFLQPFFENAAGSKWKALVITSVLSGIRGFGGGTLAGPIDFALALVWGGIYIEGGLVAALITHMVWDIFFVYFSP